VPAGKRFLVPVPENDTISGIQKISRFKCRLLWADTKNSIYSAGCLGEPTPKIKNNRAPGLGPSGLDPGPTLLFRGHAEIHPHAEDPAIAVVAVVEEK
jgi:hypothetical protein